MRYIVKNDEDDLKIMVRSFSEFEHLPYRELDIDTLGKPPDLTCVTKEDLIPEAVASMAEDPQGYQLSRDQKKWKKRSSPKKISKQTIFERITKFLNGFEVEVEDTTDEEQEPTIKEINHEVSENDINV